MRNLIKVEFVFQRDTNENSKGNSQINFSTLLRPDDGWMGEFFGIFVDNYRCCG